MVITHHLRKSSILFLKIISPIFFSLAIVCMYYKLQNNLFPFSFLFNIQHSFLRKKFHAIQVYKILLKISIKKRKKSNFINLPRREDCFRHLYKINIFIRSEKKFHLNYNLTHITFYTMKKIYSHFAVIK